MTAFCPGCGGGDLLDLLTLPAVPVNSCLLLQSREEARRFPRGDISLCLCNVCMLIFNAAFDATLTRYAAGYEEVQGFSETYSRFEASLVDVLVERYSLRGKSVIEIGCGKGDFLLRLCGAGQNRGVGFDPAFDPARVPSTEARVSFVRDFYSRRYSQYRADFYCCKMTLEHIADPADFVAMLRDAIRGDAEPLVFVMVPDAARIMAQAAFEDVYYEHCSYFTEQSLKNLFRLNGFRIVDTRLVFGGQYLILTAKWGGQAVACPSLEHLPGALRNGVATFGQKVDLCRRAWGRRFDKLAESGARTVLWGGGSKAVAFLTGVPESVSIEYVVDVNPYRQGSFLPVTGQVIVAPDFLRGYRPDVVIVMNPLYEGEIRDELQRCGLSPEVLLPGSGLADYKG